MESFEMARIIHLNLSEVKLFATSTWKCPLSGECHGIATLLIILYMAV
jgi:hypothetical protein